MHIHFVNSGIIFSYTCLVYSCSLCLYIQYIPNRSRASNLVLCLYIQYVTNTSAFTDVLVYVCMYTCMYACVNLVVVCVVCDHDMHALYKPFHRNVLCIRLVCVYIYIYICI
jgi:hypothetical protein